MEKLHAFADISIRRACGFVGLAMVTVMISLSFDPVLALRTGAEMAATLFLALAFAAWRTPRRNMRHTEVHAMLRGDGVPSNWLSTEVNRAQIATVWRTRLACRAGGGRSVGAVGAGRAVLAREEPLAPPPARGIKADGCGGDADRLATHMAGMPPYRSPA